MATCLNCGKEVSNSAVHCPYCGENLQNQNVQFVLMALLCGISPGALIVALFNLLLELPILLNWVLAMLTSILLLHKCNYDIFLFLKISLVCLVLWFFGINLFLGILGFDTIDLFGCYLDFFNRPIIS